LNVELISYFSKIDRTMQPALISPAKGEDIRPLVVCLHTWGGNLKQPCDHFLAECRKRNWHFIFPHFRGPNCNPEACGSDSVVSDLECAVEYMKEHYQVDEKRIYLLGGSGGGHAALLMAGRRPDLFCAISAWCPISDIRAWYIQTHDKKAISCMRGYDADIYKVCGGDPTSNQEAEKQARYRSPMTWLKEAKGKVILDIGAGIHDGHVGSVPISHAILAYNEIVDPEDRIAQEDIDYIVENEKIPNHLQFQGNDSAYGSYKVLLRRSSGMVRLTLFEGGHDILVSPAFGFLNNQVRGNKPVWNSGNNAKVKLTELTK